MNSPLIPTAVNLIDKKSVRGKVPADGLVSLSVLERARRYAAKSGQFAKASALGRLVADLLACCGMACGKYKAGKWYPPGKDHNKNPVHPVPDPVAPVPPNEKPELPDVPDPEPPVAPPPPPPVDPKPEPGFVDSILVRLKNNSAVPASLLVRNEPVYPSTEVVISSGSGALFDRYSNTQHTGLRLSIDLTGEISPLYASVVRLQDDTEVLELKLQAGIGYQGLLLYEVPISPTSDWDVVLDPEPEPEPVPEPEPGPVGTVRVRFYNSTGAPAELTVENEPILPGTTALLVGGDSVDMARFANTVFTRIELENQVPVGMETFIAKVFRDSDNALLNSTILMEEHNGLRHILHSIPAQESYDVSVYLDHYDEQMPPGPGQPPEDPEPPVGGFVNLVFATNFMPSMDVWFQIDFHYGTITDTTTPLPIELYTEETLELPLEWDFATIQIVAYGNNFTILTYVTDMDTGFTDGPMAVPAGIGDPFPIFQFTNNGTNLRNFKIDMVHEGYNDTM